MFGISGYVMGGMAAVIAALVIFIGIQAKRNSINKEIDVVSTQ
jgi:hypothetical protein